MPRFELQHVSLIVADTGAALDFYCRLLGFEREPSRPALDFAGAWLRAGAGQVHLLELPNPDPLDGRPGHGGRDRHAAFLIDDLGGLQARLDEANWPYTLSRSGRRALFCRDPDANALEFIESQ